MSSVVSCPKITDFGLAKQLREEDRSTLRVRTGTGAILGTPSYMAPEQTGGAEVGPAVDVYALGAILYEALTGRPPFQGESPLDTLEQVRSRDPVPPARLQPKVPRDLETVCLKCLEKEPHRRYASAQDLADDLGRFLRDEPIHARPAGPGERAWKWARRRPAVAGLLAALLLLTAAGFTTVTILWRQAAAAFTDAESARQKEAEQRRQAEAHLAARLVTLARTEWVGNRQEKAKEYLGEVPVALRDRDWRLLDRMCNAELATLENPNGVGPPGVAFNPDGRRFVTSGGVRLRIWDAASGQIQSTLTGVRDMAAPQLAFSADGARLTAVFSTVTLLQRGQRAKRLVRVWDTNSGEVVGPRWDHPELPRCVLSHDGRHLIVQETDEEIGLRDLPSGRLIQRFSLGETFRAATLSADGRRLVCVGQRKGLLAWDTTTGERTHSVPELSHPSTLPLELTADGRYVAAVSSSEQRPGEVRVWDLDMKKVVVTVRAHTDAITGTAFSPDGRRFATASKDRTVILWDRGTGRELLTFRGHTRTVTGLAFSPDGQRLVSVGQDKTVRVWDARPFEE